MNIDKNFQILQQANMIQDNQTHKACNLSEKNKYTSTKKSKNDKNLEKGKLCDAPIECITIEVVEYKTRENSKSLLQVDIEGADPTDVNLANHENRPNTPVTCPMDHSSALTISTLGNPSAYFPQPEVTRIKKLSQRRLVAWIIFVTIIGVAAVILTVALPVLIGK